MSDQQIFFGTEHPFTTDKDISSDAFWTQSFRERDETFGWLRSNAPVSWHPPMGGQGFPNEEAGFWAVTKSADIRYVSENHGIFSSAISGTLTVRPTPPFPPSMIVSDPPEHERYRRMISSAFTPKAVARLVEKIEQRAEEIVDGVVGAGDIDFVPKVSARLPMLTVADLVGIPDSMVEAFTHAGDMFASASDPRVRPEGVSPGEFMMEQVAIVSEIGIEVVRHRRKYPADDLATMLAGPVDGRMLTDAEIGMTTQLLATAGNDTTKQTTSWAVHQLWNSPDQMRWLAEDFDNRIAGAVEEFVRHASPVTSFTRTATEDTVLRGVKIAKHDKVVMYYASGNRDEEIYADPWKFDLSRQRNPHVGFGGGGIHYCLGNAVAKAQLRALFRQFLHKLPDMKVYEPICQVNENFNVTSSLPVYIP